jgi:hypothetical protein
MDTVESGKTRQQWQQEAAIALVNILPEPTTAVAVIEFDSDANTVQVLTQLTTNKAAVIAAIQSIDSGGLTDIGEGIDVGAAELTSSRHTPGRLQMMLVTSDGEVTSGTPTPGESADAAIALGVDQIHSVGLPGHDVATMQSLVDGPNDVYDGGPDDHGVYTGVSDLTDLEDIFTGTGGSLVGLDYVDLTLPDGTFLADYPTDGLGNFTYTGWSMQLGANTFTADAYGTDGSSATASLTLLGKDCPGPAIPEPSTFLLLGIGIVGLAGGFIRRRMKK